MENIIELTPALKNYAWGNTDFIPSMLGVKPDGQPVAELWMGVHRLGSCVISSTGQSLRDFLDSNPDFAGCGADDFPYLFKVLAINKPLSIQCHPNTEQAKKGFEEGNPNYSDPNQKAEMFYSLSPCTLLCGFRKQPEHNEETENLFKLFNELYPGDPAAEYAYKLNLIHLEEGEAIFLKPGIPHAYLSGNGIELMTNSDNVLRLGLTSKRIDKKELYKIMIQSAYDPNLLGSMEDEGGEHFYTPAGFTLNIMKDGFFRSKDDSPRIFICTEGKALLNDGFELSKGKVCIAAKGATVDVDADGTVFYASN